MDVFVFGTLSHLPLLEIVSGDRDISQRTTWAVRPGYSVSRVVGQVFAMVHTDSDGVAEGMRVQGVDDATLARLDYYEKALGYERTSFAVLDADKQSHTGVAYLPEPDRWQADEPWDRAAWTEQHGALTTETAIEVMSNMSTTPAHNVGAIYPFMTMRAASRLRAAKTTQAGTQRRDDVHLIEARNRYAGFINVQELQLSHRKFDGTMSETMDRAVMVGTDCAMVLPYDPVRDRVLVVEQFRPGAYLRGDHNPWTIEPVAGLIDPGETPEDAARREAAEEAGVDIGALHCVSAAYPSPGATTEHFFIFIGETDLPDGIEGVGGLASEAEDIRSHVMDWADFDSALNAGTFRLLPLLVAGHWLARNRERLRASA